MLEFVPFKQKALISQGLVLDRSRCPNACSLQVTKGGFLPPQLALLACVNRQVKMMNPCTASISAHDPDSRATINSNIACKRTMHQHLHRVSRGWRAPAISALASGALQGWPVDRLWDCTPCMPSL